MRAAMRTPSRSVAFSCGAIGAHVADAGFGIRGDAQGRGEIRRRVVAGRRDRHRQGFQAAVRPAQRVALDDDLLARRRCHSRSAQSDWRWRASRRRRSPRPRSPCRPRRFAPMPRARRSRPACRNGGRRSPTTLVNKNARRSSSSSPPWNCQRTSGCSSVSLLIARSMRRSRPCASSRARCSWKSSGGPAVALWPFRRVGLVEHSTSCSSRARR